MMHWFESLLPREERFFDLFTRHSDAVAASAKALRDMLEGGDAVPRHCMAVMDREQDADNITREVLIAVRRTFITPFDRGDITRRRIAAARPRAKQAAFRVPRGGLCHGAARQERI
jgi:uncharacterized protein Yka (UPF0111/DUF47 family)